MIAVTTTGEEVKRENSGAKTFGRRTSIVAHKSIMNNPVPPPTPPTVSKQTSQNSPMGVKSNDDNDMVISGIVPHLAAHTAEFTAIYEISEFIPDSPHLININKKVMITKSLLFLARLQRSVYKLQPIRLVSTVINRSIQPYQYFSNSESSAATTELYKLSFVREPG